MIETGQWAAVVLAAGKGTRMKSVVPKVMHGLLGKPLIWHALRPLRELGVDRVIVVTGHGGKAVRNYLAGQGVETVEQHEQMGTAHATACAGAALREFDGDVLILCGDTPLLREETLAAFMADHSAAGRALSLLSARLTDPAGYGRVLREDPSGSVAGIVEEKDASPLQRDIAEINTGIFAVKASFLFDAVHRVKTDNAQGEYYLTDIVGIGVSDGKSVGALCRATEEEAWGVNSRWDLSRAESVLLERIRRHWNDEGVTLELASSIYIEPEVMLSPDVVIGPHSVLKGNTIIGVGASIGAFSFLNGVKVAARQVVPPFSHLVAARRTGSGDEA